MDTIILVIMKACLNNIHYKVGDVVYFGDDYYHYNKGKVISLYKQGNNVFCNVENKNSAQGVELISEQYLFNSKERLDKFYKNSINE